MKAARWHNLWHFPCYYANCHNRPSVTLAHRCRAVGADVDAAAELAALSFRPRPTAWVPLEHRALRRPETALDLCDALERLACGGGGGGSAADRLRELTALKGAVRRCFCTARHSTD